MKPISVLLVLAAILSPASAFVPAARLTRASGVILSAEGSQESSLSRRSFAAASASLAILLGRQTPVSADDEEAEPAPVPAAAPAPKPAVKFEDVPVSKSKANGLLESYVDVNRGWRINRPSGWNQFEQLPGVYDMKWVDLVSRDETVVVTTSPVKSTTTSIDALGDVQEVGQKLAASRDSSLVSAKAVSKEGVGFYMFEFASDKNHELLELCIGKGKLWSVSHSASPKHWDANLATLYEKSQLSFMPRL